MSARAAGPLRLTWITDHLAVGPAPVTPEAMDQLRAAGVRSVLNLSNEFTDLPEIEADQGFEVYHLPIPDEEAPDLDELEKALDWLDEALYLGKKTYIHCRHGFGRTGTVLNAYLLRRGLGHGRAWLALRNRPQPANFHQWRAVRRYGGRAPKLKLRKPSVEHKFIVDLAPFFTAYEDLVRRAGESLPPGEGGRCGREHVRCCQDPPRLSLVEAAYLNSAVNTLLDRETRSRVVEEAAGQARAGEGGEAGHTGPCPLLQDQACLLFGQRPLRCRTSGLAPEESARLWTVELDPALEELSRSIHFALAGCFMAPDFPAIRLAEAVSGRYVQLFFNCCRGLGQGAEGQGV